MGLRMQPMLRTGMLAFAAALSFGCSRAAQVEADREILYQAEANLTIRIVNRSQLDATIYLLHDGVRDRLGLVTAATTGSFPVRGRTLTSGEFALLADPVGATRTTTSESLHTSQGQQFTWTLERDFSRGSMQVQ
jgi:hypothetical protein